MASRWFNLLLGVILLQSVLAFGPIDVTDAEWIEYMGLINNPNYRLPTTTRPLHYKVRLQPNLDQDFELNGDVEINIKVESGNQPINEIKLHCQDMVINSLTITSTTNTENLAQGTQLVCEETTSFLTIPTTQLPNGNEYIIKISFVGKLQSGMRGFYRSWFFDENKQKRWMATTQFQPGHARQAFPCYDEPGFKATFDIILVRDDSLISLSNMPIEATVPSTLYPQKKEDIYYTTPIMSTYLLAFIVADYKRIESGTNVNRPFHIYARGNVGDTGKYSLEVGEKLLTLMESYTQYNYYTMANKMEMKQAAIPDFSAGAMENWGLLTYREALILYDPENSNNFYKQRIANIISHEIAHMWFGNLVTCAWWDTLWLNEGFARYYQYYMTDKAEPHMGFKTRFIVEQLQVAMLSDSFSNAHALTNPAVSDPDSVSNHFSTITYAKGASILRMTEHLLGGDTYEKGLREYLKKRAFNTAEPKDLFESLDAAANADNSLADYDDMTIAKYFASWSEKAGHPLLTVHVDHASGRMTVVQTQFDVNSGVSSDNGLWHIPLTWTRAGNPEFENLKPSEFMSGPLKIINRGSTGREWVIFNKQQSGFYRVNYDATTWALLTQALRSNQREAIHEYNRAQIVDDVFVLARSNILSYTRALNILSFLEFEDKYAPWVAAITGFNFALRRLAHKTEEQQKLKDIIFKSSAAIIQRLGYTEASNADPLFMDNLLRMHLMTFLCNAGHAQCSQTGREYFKAWRESGTRIPPNMRPWVYCEGLRTGDLADFDYFWNRYVDEDLSNEKVVMIGAAGCTGNTEALHKFLSVIVDPKPTEQSTELIRPQDYSAAISSAVTSNEYNTMKVLEWLKDNPSHLQNGNGVSLLRSAASRLLNEMDILRVETWFATITSDEAIQAIKDGIATSRSNIKWYVSRVGEFSDYFETGYFDDLTGGSETPDPTTPEPTTAEPTTPEPTTPEPTTAEPTTAEPTTDESTPAEPTTAEPTTAEPEPGSANIASLSFFTLLVTLIINMV